MKTKTAPSSFLRGRSGQRFRSLAIIMLLVGCNFVVNHTVAQAQSLPINLGIGLGRNLLRSATRHRSANAAPAQGDPNAAAASQPVNNPGLPGYPTYSGYGSYPIPNAGANYSAGQPAVGGYPNAPGNYQGVGYPGTPSNPSVYPNYPGVAPVPAYTGYPPVTPGSTYPGYYPTAPAAANMAAPPTQSSYSGRSSAANRKARSSAVSAYNKSIKYFNSHNYDQAMPLLAQALQADPRMGSAYALLAVCQSKTGKLSEAMQNFEMAQNFGSHYQSLLYEEGLCAARMRNYAVAASCLREFIAHGRGAAQADEAEKALSVLQNNFGKQPDGDYLADASRAGQRRWAAAALPLHVYISENQSLRGYRSEFAALVKQSFDEWAQGSNGKLAFVYVTEPSQAQIKVSWTDNEADLGTGDTKELGLTLTTFADGVIESADIKLHTLIGVCSTDPAELFPQAKCVALHEIGHALGLQHSTQAYDTMYPLVPPKGFEYSLTRRDLNTVTALYSQNPAPLTTMDSLKLLPHSELSAQKGN